jgi:AcrR family transcriptional regulator
MPSDEAPQRPIDATRQRKQANRDAMVDAAAELFASVGYAATTMDAVAAGSDMSVQSVYFAFHAKANLLRAALERATPPPPGRPTGVDPDECLVLLVEDAVRSLEATGPLALAAAAAAPGDPAVEEVRAGHAGRRSQSAVYLVHHLRSLRPLAPGVTPRRVVDVVYGLLSPQLHALLVQERGWTSKRYARWSANAIGRALWG